MQKPQDDLEKELDEIASDYIIKDYNIDLYHYTSLEALKSIIDNSCLWASNSFFLNDSKEIVYLKDFLNIALNETAESSEFESVSKEKFFRFVEATYAWVIEYYKSRLYVLSLTDKNDNLTLWLNYGNNDGYNIKINVADLVNLAKEKKKVTQTISDSSSIENTEVNIGVFFAKIVYDESKIKSVLKKYLILLSKYFKSSKESSNYKSIARIGFSLGNFAYIAKHKSFEPESEYRILLSGLDKESEIFLRKFRMRSGVLVPYTEISFKNDDNKNPIKEIVIGPKKNIELGMLGLQYYLQHKNLNHISIKSSNLPLRD